MTRTLQLPDIRRILDDLGRRIGILERRLTAAPADASRHSHDGTGSNSVIVHESVEQVAAEASGDVSVAVGARAQSLGEAAIAVGYNADAVGNSSIAAGETAGAYGAGAVALGAFASTNGANTTALGANAQANYANSTAVGTGANPGSANEIALGTSAEHVMVHGRLVLKAIGGGGYFYLNVAADGTLSTEAY